MDIIDTNLSTADTESLLAVMVSGVEEVRLGMDVTLDMEMLAQYDGKGECRRVGVWVDGGSAAPREEAAAEGGRDPPPPNTDELRRKRKV